MREVKKEGENMSEKEKSQEVRIATTPEETMSLMVNTINHHFNNKLVPVVAYPDFMETMQGIKDNPRALAFIKDIREAGILIARYVELMGKLKPDHLIMLPGTNIIDLEKSTHFEPEQ